jgi:hypothetical protein
MRSRSVWSVFGVSYDQSDIVTIENWPKSEGQGRLGTCCEAGMSAASRQWKDSINWPKSAVQQLATRINSVVSYPDCAKGSSRWNSAGTEKLFSDNEV